ncbi:MAG: glycoside hydrolase family 16 protein [Capnocytophaga sp.]|nr:glycoside hydrolase family 16 protein [Capnocytophaga sp.]
MSCSHNDDSQTLSPLPDQNLQLVFIDDFNETALDEKIWTPHRGTEPHTYGNPYNPAIDDNGFDKNQVSVKDGNLILSWEKKPITIEQTTYPYSAGVVHSGKGLSFSYGYIEARIWFSKGSGLTPAFWLIPMPVDDHWPPEIDIAELTSDDTPDGLYKPHFNYHWSDNLGNHQQMQWRWYGVQNVDYAGEWHTYGLMRKKGFLQVYIDGEPGPSFKNNIITDELMYVVLSTGIKKGSRPDNGKMLVDWVKVWK